METREPPSDDPDHPGERYRGHRLARRGSIAFIGIALAILIFGIALFLGYRQHETARLNALAADKTAANLLSTLILEHNKATIGILQSYAYRPLFIDAVKTRNLAGAYRHLESLKQNSEIDLTFVTDTRGILWANFPSFPEAIGKNLSYRDWYQGVTSEWKPYVSTVFKLIVGDKPLAVAVSVPIFDEKARPIGILSSSQRLGYLEEIIRQIPFIPDTTVNVVDREGKLLYSNRYPHRENVTDYRFYSVIAPALKKGLPMIEIEDPQANRQRRYLSLAPIREIGWTIVVARSAGDIYRSNLIYFFWTGFVSVLLFLMLVFLFVYLGKVSLFKKTEELLRVEKKLRRSEQSERETRDYLENLIVYANAPIIVWDPQFRITRVNHAFELLSGRTAGDVLGREIDLLFPDDRRQECLERIRQATGGDRWESMEIPILHRDGSLRTVLWNSATLYGEDGKAPIASIAHGQDITERKRAEDALRESEKKFREMVETIPLAIYLSVGVEQRCEYLNPMFVKLFGYTLQDLPTVEQWWPLAYPDDAYRRQISETWTARVKAAIAAQSPIESMEVVVTCKDGSQKNISWGYVTIGEKNYAYGLDLTRQKQAEQEIQELNAELEQRVIDRTAQLTAANRELEAFSYSLSHDLRAPLRGIDGLSLALIEDYQNRPLDDIGRNYLERVRRATQRIGALIDDMLKLFRITRSEMKQEAVDLSGMIREVAEAYQKIRPDRTVEVTVREGCVVLGDPSLLRIAVENLLDNAFKFTGREAYPRIGFGTEVRDGETAFFVRDNGVGFDMTYAGKLFSAFQRLHTADEFIGLGIGLATVQRIIHRHGGRVWAEGVIGKGASVFFTLRNGGGDAGDAAPHRVHLD